MVKHGHSNMEKTFSQMKVGRIEKTTIEVLNHVLVSSFPAAVIKCSNRRNLRQKEFTVGHIARCIYHYGVL